MDFQSQKVSRRLKTPIVSQEKASLVHRSPVDLPPDHLHGSPREEAVRKEEAEEARQAATTAQNLVDPTRPLVSKKDPEMIETEAREIDLKKKQGKEKEKKRKEAEAVGKGRKQKIVNMANVSTTMILVVIVVKS